MQHDEHVWAWYRYHRDVYMALPLPEPEIRRRLPRWMQIQPWLGPHPDQHEEVADRDRFGRRPRF